jgi:L-glutamine-phosphate cytidylyltransferase|tara:strand:- start:114 stop:839 length:726 start_codon:yes stop_codon:yes gene_type:complete
MKAIILAAGQSSRLYPLTINHPKCLLEVSEGQSIIELQISMLNKIGIKDILVVTGFESDKIVKRLGQKVKYHFYQNYMKTNNLFTMNSLVDNLKSESIILFSDIVISKVLLEECVNSRDDFNLLIDDHDITDKTMRVKLNEEKIVDIGSHILPSKGDGNFIGIAKYSKLGIQLLKDKIINICQNNKYINDYYTIAISEISKMGNDIMTTNNKGKHYWSEIDFVDDYNKLKNNYSKISDQLF